MNKTVLFSGGPSSDNKNKTILIIVIICIIVFLSFIIFLYIQIVIRKNNSTDPDPDLILEPTLWRNAITKDDINLEDIYQKETNKRLVINPIARST